MKYVIWLCANLMLPGSGTCTVQEGYIYENTKAGRWACHHEATARNDILGEDSDRAYYCSRTGKRKNLQIARSKPENVAKRVQSVTIRSADAPSAAKTGKSDEKKVAEAGDNQKRKPEANIPTKETKKKASKRAKTKKTARWKPKPKKEWHPLGWLFGGG